MRSTVLTALLLSGCALARASSVSSGANAAAGSGALQSIGVFFDFENRPPSSTVDAMEHEIASIMKTAGMVFGLAGTERARRRGFFHPGYIRRPDRDQIKGACEGVPAPFNEPGPGDDNSLASTKTSHGQVLHFTEVHCDEVRRYLAKELRTSVTGHGSKCMGGRWAGLSRTKCIMFSPIRRNMPIGGVARACHSRQELIQPVFAFDPKETKILRNYAMRALLSKEANPEP